MSARLDDFLTGKAAAVWPGALVYRDLLDGELYIDFPPGHVPERIYLGRRFQSARRALYQMLAAERVRRQAGDAQGPNAQEGGR